MTYFGPDGALYQKGIRLTQKDWDCISYVAWRCIHQSGKKDLSFDEMRELSQKNNKPFVAYVWVDKMSPVMKAIYTAAALKDTTIPIMVDWEDPTCSFTNMASYVDEMRKKGYKVTLLYTGKYYWQSMGSPDLTKLAMDLVLARYGNQNPLGEYECEPRYNDMMPRYSVWDWNVGGLLPSMWQFGSRIRWGDRYMDMNAILDPNVIKRAFKAWTSPAPVPVPIPDLGEEMYKFPFFARLPNNGAFYVGDGYERHWTGGPVFAQQIKVGLINPDTGAPIKTAGDGPIYDEKTMTERLGKLVF